jgi:hypothetical protein
MLMLMLFIVAANCSRRGKRVDDAEWIGAADKSRPQGLKAPTLYGIYIAGDKSPAYLATFLAFGPAVYPPSFYTQ